LSYVQEAFYSSLIWQIIWYNYVLQEWTEKII